MSITQSAPSLTVSDRAGSLSRPIVAGDRGEDVVTGAVVDEQPRRFVVTLPEPIAGERRAVRRFDEAHTVTGQLREAARPAEPALPLRRVDQVTAAGGVRVDDIARKVPIIDRDGDRVEVRQDGPPRPSTSSVDVAEPVSLPSSMSLWVANCSVGSASAAASVGVAASVAAVGAVLSGFSSDALAVLQEVAVATIVATSEDAARAPPGARLRWASHSATAIRRRAADAHRDAAVR